MNLIDAGYWTSPEQCEAADYIRQLHGKLAKTEMQLEYMETIRRENALYFEKREQELISIIKVCKETLLDCEAALDECRGYPITYDEVIESLVKISEVLK